MGSENLMETHLCANCCCQLVQIKEEEEDSNLSFEDNYLPNTYFELIIPQENEESTKITILDVMTSIYKLNYAVKLNPQPNQHFNNQENGIGLCHNCTQLLSQLYKMYSQFNSIRHNNSFFAKQIHNLDTLVDSCSCKIFKTQNPKKQKVTPRKSPRQRSKIIKSFHVESDVEDDPPPSRDSHSDDPDFESPCHPQPESPQADEPEQEVEKPASGQKSKKKSVKEKKEPEKEVDDGPQKCGECGKILRNSKSLKNHLLVHSQSDQPKNFLCSDCGQTFYTKRNLKIHSMRRHQKDKTHKCGVCDKSFFSKRELHSHTANKHGTDKSFQCSICQKSFASPSVLKQHSRRHDVTQKTFLCAECGSSFFLQTDLERHSQLVHGNERKHLCKVCGRAFKLDYHCRRHEETHLGKCKICPVCNVAFTSRMIKGHLKSHSTQSIPPLVETPMGRQVQNLDEGQHNLHGFIQGAS